MSEYLHIYAQDVWHDEAFIVGNREGLEALRDALNKALENPFSTARCFVNDGEGYACYIAECKDEQKLDLLAVPYTDQIATEQNESSIWPEQFFAELVNQSAPEVKHGT